MVHSLTLFASLFATWLLLSGMFEPLLLGLGVASCALVVLIGHRMAIIDIEVSPVQIRSGRLVPYWIWLSIEIVKAAVDVTRRVLDPKLPIAPTVQRLRAGQKTNIGRVTYANSITLTPGTVSIDFLDEEITVHALTREGIEDLERGEMDRRVCELEG